MSRPRSHRCVLRGIVFARKSEGNRSGFPSVQVVLFSFPLGGTEKENTKKIVFSVENDGLILTYLFHKV